MERHQKQGEFPGIVYPSLHWTYEEDGPMPLISFQLKVGHHLLVYENPVYELHTSIENKLDQQVSSVSL
jgi:hypothetical protein